MKDAKIRMRNAWGDDAADWLHTLADHCDRTSQSRVGKELGYSAATVSLVLANRYKGDVTTFMRAVRGAYMQEFVICPVLHKIATNECLAHQRRPFSTANSQRIRLFKACRNNCPHSRLTQKENPDAV